MPKPKGKARKPAEIPPANADLLWHHVLPSKLFDATHETLTRFNAFASAVRGFGISPLMWEKLPDDLKAIFDKKALGDIEWDPIENY